MPQVTPPRGAARTSSRPTRRPRRPSASSKRPARASAGQSGSAAHEPVGDPSMAQYTYTIFDGQSNLTGATFEAESVEDAVAQVTGVLKDAASEIPYWDYPPGHVIHAIVWREDDRVVVGSIPHEPEPVEVGHARLLADILTAVYECGTQQGADGEFEELGEADGFVAALAALSEALCWDEHPDQLVRKMSHHIALDGYYETDTPVGFPVRYVVRRKDEQ